MKVFVPGTGLSLDFRPVVDMFRNEGWEIVKSIPEANLVCFTGGSDVSPSLYGEKNTSSYCDEGRDFIEEKIYTLSLRLGIPMVGICRGGQFLNVMNGGKMIQHIDGHSGDRDIRIVRDGDETILTIREDHHQGIVVSTDLDTSVEIIARDVTDGNVEIVYYEGTNCLCFQPHPEWGHEGTKRLFFQMIEEYL